MSEGWMGRQSVAYLKTRQRPVWLEEEAGGGEADAQF